MARELDISKIDVNFASVSVDCTDAKFYDVKDDPFEIYGLYSPKTEPVFKRLPDDVGLNTNRGVKSLYTNTAGGRLRFSTDSDYVVIRAFMSVICQHSHMTHLGTRGFDMYIDDPETGASSFYGAFMPPKTMEGDGYEQIIRFKTKEIGRAHV